MNKLLDIVAGVIFLLSVSAVLPICACMSLLLFANTGNPAWLFLMFVIMAAIAWACDRI